MRAHSVGVLRRRRRFVSKPELMWSTLRKEFSFPATQCKFSRTQLGERLLFFFCGTTGKILKIQNFCGRGAPPQNVRILIFLCLSTVQKGVSFSHYYCSPAASGCKVINIFIFFTHHYYYYQLSYSIKLILFLIL